jgi:hypothetical protein
MRKLRIEPQHRLRKGRGERFADLFEDLIDLLDPRALLLVDDPRLLTAELRASS